MGAGKLVHVSIALGLDVSYWLEIVTVRPSGLTTTAVLRPSVQPSCVTWHLLTMFTELTPDANGGMSSWVLLVRVEGQQSTHPHIEDRQRT